jgi:mono/diheme cytochrome c family protein
MMRRFIALSVLVLLIGCPRWHKKVAPEQRSVAGAAIVESSGGKQLGYMGRALDENVVVQVNDEAGSGVAGAMVDFSGAAGMSFAPPAVLTDSNGQASTVVTLGSQAGRYEVIAHTRNAAGKELRLTLDETALGYQQTLGAQLNAQYCARCHDPESIPERVSNMDNLAVKPHPFGDGEVLNKMSDADITVIIGRGGAALSMSHEMPPWGRTLSQSDIAALVSYVRAVSDPPYQPRRLIYAEK